MHRCAKGGFDGRFIATLHRKQVAHGAQNTGQAAVIGGLHHRFYAVGIALHIFFQIPQDLQTVFVMLDLSGHGLFGIVCQLEVLAALLQLHGKAVFDIFQPRQRFIQFFQIFRVFFLFFLLLFQVFRRFLLLMAGCLQARRGGFHRALFGGSGHAGFGLAFRQLRHSRCHCAAPLTGLQIFCLDRFQLALQIADRRFQTLDLLAGSFDFFAVFRNFLCDLLLACCRLFLFFLQAFHAGMVVGNVVVQHSDLAVCPAHFLGDGADIGIAALDLYGNALHILAQAAAFFVNAADLLGQAVIIGLSGLIFSLFLAHHIPGTAHGVHPQGDLQLLAAGRKFQKAVGLGALFFQRAHAPL